MNTLQDRLIVTGASGGLGRAVVEELLRLGASTVVATTRTPERLADLQARGVEVRAADFDRPESLREAFQGVNRLALISTDALEVPGHRVVQHRAAIDAATDAGVKHVVYTSAPSPFPTPEGTVIGDHFWTEAALFAAPFTWTVLRNHLYMETVLMAAAHALESGKLYSATAGKGRAYVSREDCARAIAGALIQARHSEVLDVSGPAAVSLDELAAVLSEVTGRSVEHVGVSPEELTAGLAHAGLPLPLVSALVTFDVQASQGFHAIVTPTVERLTGVQPTDLRTFLKEHYTAGQK